ncbi:MAG: energy transducer TonB [Gammaproteobacteria bacterium]
MKFLFENGVVKNPEIVTSTGNPQLDQLLLKQVVTAKVPKPFGLQTDQPHEFELLLELFTPYESFQYNVYAAIGREKEYPRNPLLQDIMGITTLDFDYQDAKAHNIVVAKSSGNKQLDKVSLDAVSKAELPAAPPGYSGKTVPMRVTVCYCINSTKSCPPGKNVIIVEATRIVRVETTVITP